MYNSRWTNEEIEFIQKHFVSAEKMQAYILSPDGGFEKFEKNNFVFPDLFRRASPHQRKRKLAAEKLPRLHKKKFKISI